MLINHILIVEDEAIVASDIQYSLQKLGFFVTGVAASGELALSMIKSSQPDLILMDIMIQGKLSGLDTAELIMKTYSIPIIFLTAYVDEVTLSRAKKCEPFGYIIKPFKEIQLQTAIEMALYKFKKEDDLIKERNLLYSIMDNSKIMNDMLFIKSENKIVKIKLADIYFIHADQSEVVIYTNNSEFKLHSSINELKEKTGELFIQLSDQFLINKEKVLRIDYPTIYFKDIFKVIKVINEDEPTIDSLFNL